MRSDKRSKLERVRDELKDVGKQTRRDTRAMLNDWNIPEYPDEPDAPDLNDYDEEERIGEYLAELHEWAIRKYAEAVDELQRAAAIDASAYPKLGHDHPEDRNTREEHTENVLELAEALEELDYWREQLHIIEDEWKDR